MSPLRHSRRVAAGSVFYRDAVLSAVVKVDVIGANCCRANEFHPATLEQRAVATGAGAGEKHLGIAHITGSGLRSRQVNNLMTGIFKKAVDIGNFAVGNYFHQAITIAIINAVSIATSIHIVTGWRVS